MAFSKETTMPQTAEQLPLFDLEEITGTGIPAPWPMDLPESTPAD